MHREALALGSSLRGESGLVRKGVVYPRAHSPLKRRVTTIRLPSDEILANEVPTMLVASSKRIEPRLEMAASPVAEEPKLTASEPEVGLSVSVHNGATKSVD